MRDPYWLSVGVESLVAGNGTTPAHVEVTMSQPEVILYDYISTGDRPGYPDFIQVRK